MFQPLAVVPRVSINTDPGILLFKKDHPQTKTYTVSATAYAGIDSSIATLHNRNQQIEQDIKNIPFALAKGMIKNISVQLLDELKKDKLNIELWWEKTETSAAVYKIVNDSLFQVLPYPTYEQTDIDLKTNLVFEHLKSQYHGGGRSVYGGY